jgi:hypothetical protein
MKSAANVRDEPILGKRNIRKPSCYSPSDSIQDKEPSPRKRQNPGKGRIQ